MRDLPKGPWIDKLCSLRIKIWRYHKEIDPQQRIHIGPLANQWRDMMGVGDGVTIDQIDATGILIRSIQELKERVDYLEGKLDERTHQ